MLMHIFDTSDFERSLRRRRWVGFGLLAVGLVGILCYFLLIDGSDVLPDFARGFYLGGASGICIGSVFLLVRTTYLLSNPAARKKAKIQEPCPPRRPGRRQRSRSRTSGRKPSSTRPSSSPGCSPSSPPRPPCSCWWR